MADERASTAHDVHMRTEPPRIGYGPAYGPRTEWENFVLVQALQEAQGQVSGHVRGIAVEAGYEMVVIHACLDAEEPDTVEDLEELVHDLDGVLEDLAVPAPTVRLQLHVGDTDPDWSGYEHRRLYLMHWRARADDVPE